MCVCVCVCVCVLNHKVSVCSICKHTGFGQQPLLISINLPTVYTGQPPYMHGFKIKECACVCVCVCVLVVCVLVVCVCVCVCVCVWCVHVRVCVCMCVRVNRLMPRDAYLCQICVYRYKIILPDPLKHYTN